MDKLQDRKENRAGLLVKLVLLCVIVAAGAVGIFCFKGSPGVLCILAVYILFYVVFPGAFLTECMGLQGEHFSTTVARSFLVGFSINVILYFLSDPLGNDFLLYAVCPVLSILYLIRKVRNRSKRALLMPLFMLQQAPVLFCLLVAVVFIYSLLSTQYTFVSPEYGDFSRMKVDYQYHCGIINSLAQDFPVQDPWVDGRLIEYHVFTEMLYAIPVRLFGLTSESILLSGTPYLIAFIIPISMYSFFREMMQRSEMAAGYSLMLIGSNMFMLKAFGDSWFMFHVLSNINSASYGVCCLLVMIPLLKAWDRQDKKAGPWAYVFLLVLTMLLTGIKGPFGAVFIGGLIGSVILGLFFGRRSVGNIMLAGGSSAAFLLVYVLLIGANNSNTSGGRLINIGEVTDTAFYKESLLQFVHSAGLPDSFSKLALLAVFCLFFFTAFSLPFVAGYIRELVLVFSRKKSYEISRVTVYACCLVGFLGMMILNYSGHSQVYFGFVTALLVPAVAFWFFEDLHPNRSWWMKAIRVVFVLGMALSVLSLLGYFYDKAERAEEYAHTYGENQSRYRNISHAEYEAMLWLRDHTPEDALIASDRYYSTAPEEYVIDERGSNTHFLYAVYSQRRQYLEGSGFSLSASEVGIREDMINHNKLLYDPENANRGDDARRLGISYVVVSKRFNKAGTLANDDYRLCFHNEDIDIYAVQ